MASGHQMTGSSRQNATLGNAERNRMRKRVFCFALCAMLFALCSLASAQQPTKIPRIGYLTGARLTAIANRTEAFRQGLRERGYIEGQNIATEYQYAAGKVDGFSKLAAELVRLKVDLIVVAGGYRVMRAVMNATKTIPIVTTGGGLDPVEAG
jgi:putative tryptophan/tyrosine transport system substrate-binding protein